jgi:hypothetical protein
MDWHTLSHILGICGEPHPSLIWLLLAPWRMFIAYAREQLGYTNRNTDG